MYRNNLWYVLDNGWAYNTYALFTSKPFSS